MAANLRKLVSTKSLVSLRGILNDGEASELLERFSTNVSHPLGGRVAGRELEAGFKLHLDRKSAKVSLFPHFRCGDLNGGGGGHKYCILSVTQVSLVARRSVLPIPPSTSTQALSHFIQVISLDPFITDIA